MSSTEESRGGPVSTGPDIRREEQISDEWEQRDRDYQDWLDRSLAMLSALYQPPWTDAGPESKERSEEERPPALPAAGEETAA